jgi:structural maintenance of chromosome 1
LSSEKRNIGEEISRLEPGKEELETLFANKESEVRNQERKINEIVETI